MTDINTAVTPSFHPDTFKEVEGYNDDTAPYVSGMINAFDTAYRMLGEVHDGFERRPGLVPTLMLMDSKAEFKRYGALIPDYSVDDPARRTASTSI